MDVESLLQNIYSKPEVNKPSAEENDGVLKIGTLGHWKGPLEERKVGVLLDSSTLQVYKKSRYGMVLFELYGLKIHKKMN